MHFSKTAKGVLSSHLSITCSFGKQGRDAFFLWQTTFTSVEMRSILELLLQLESNQIPLKRFHASVGPQFGAHHMAERAG